MIAGATFPSLPIHCLGVRAGCGNEHSSIEDLVDRPASDSTLLPPLGIAVPACSIRESRVALLSRSERWNGSNPSVPDYRGPDWPNRLACERKAPIRGSSYAPPLRLLEVLPDKWR